MEMPDDTSWVGYADDISTVIIARDVKKFHRKLKKVMSRLYLRMEEHCRCLATEKTEIVRLTRPTIVESQVATDTGSEILRSQTENQNRFCQQISASLARLRRERESLLDSC